MSAVALIVGLSLVFGSLLVFLEHYFHKKEEKTEASFYKTLLPGYNCGACGYGSCAGMAEAMCKDPHAYLKCKPMKQEQKEAIEKIMNQKETR